MADSKPTPEPVVKRGSEIEYAAVDAGEGMSKGVLVDESDGAPHFAMRRFVLDAGASVPEHTNEVEHEQYVLSGRYTVGLEDETYEVSAGDSMLIPAGIHHWYENDSGEEASFICVVPNGDDTIRVVDSE
ncbi:cupin domain-containing protein [Halorarum halophilum]|uniref:Cupin domain-containing protein n=1 Tax=Halorarum halophilum TaxID=2743090 RepID=A0A7D5KV83_9EURY|nr:cupin domain-containing protein [Halobaculum halophilum]QLG28540.1 cupin domain-containing protein [Halobaculum halophilum]